MKIKSLLLALVILAGACLLPSCASYQGIIETTSPSEERAAIIETVKEKNNGFKTFEVAGALKGKYIFKSKRGIFIQKSIKTLKPRAIVRNHYITSFMTNGDMVFYTVYEDENDPEGKKLRSQTQLFCVRTDGTMFKKIAVFDNSLFKLLGYCNGLVYFTGQQVKKTSGENVYSYSMKKAQLVRRRSSLKNIIVKSDRLFYNYNNSSDENDGLYAMDLSNPGTQDIKIVESALCEDYSDSSSIPAFWASTIKGGVRETFNYDHSFRAYENGSVRQTKKFPDNSLPLVYLSASQQSLVYCEGKVGQSGVYLWDNETGKKTMISDMPLQHGYVQAQKSKYVYFIARGNGSLADKSAETRHIYSLRDGKLVELSLKNGKTGEYEKGMIIKDRWMRYKKGRIKAYKLYEKEELKAPTTPTQPATQPSTQAKVKKNSKTKVVVLDPQYDSEVHTADHSELGLNEQDVNLTIAEVCAERLNMYKDVKVYMTRRDGGCPDKITSFGDCEKARISFANSKNADLYVGIQCNKLTGQLGSTEKGTTVYITKYTKLYSDSNKLGNLILDEISENVSLKPRGVQTRSKADKGTYEDGTVKDYDNLISSCVENGYPAVLIKHGCIDNLHDNKVLRKIAKLRVIGKADADAIAKFYNLKLKDPDAEYDPDAKHIIKL